MAERRMGKMKNSSGQQLRFTKEDRDKVFERIHKIEKKHEQKKSPFASTKKFVPAAASLLVVGLCLFLFLPSILQGEETNNNAIQPILEEEDIVTTLISVKSKEEGNRIYLNLLLSYSKDKKRMKIASLPNETYAQIPENKDDITYDGKMVMAYNHGGAENVRTTVSKLFDLPIDYYAMIDLETLSALVDALDGIEYDLQEDIRARAVSKVAFDFKKGLARLNGEQIVSLMMAATVDNNLGEEILLNLMNAVMKKTKNEIPPTVLKELFTQIETNASLDDLLEHPLETNSINLVSLREGMIDDTKIVSRTEGIYFIRFEQDFLKSISEELTTFD